MRAHDGRQASLLIELTYGGVHEEDDRTADGGGARGSRSGPRRCTSGVVPANLTEHHIARTKTSLPCTAHPRPHRESGPGFARKASVGYRGPSWIRDDFVHGAAK